jgi:hypothetical protein
VYSAMSRLHKRRACTTKERVLVLDRVVVWLRHSQRDLASGVVLVLLTKTLIRDRINFHKIFVGSLL